MTTLALAGAVLTLLGTGLTVYGTVRVAMHKRRGATEIAEVIRDEHVSPQLLARIALLETRGDAQATELVAVREAVADCEKHRYEAEGREHRCAEEVEELRGHIGELQDAILRGVDQRLSERDRDVTKRVRIAVAEAVRSTTPPGAWDPKGRSEG